MKKYVVTPEFAARFWSKVDRNGPMVRPSLGACWVWTASKLKKGYGQFAIRRNIAELAHRVAFVIAKGRAPEGGVVRHRCDNPSCVRPSHLVEGTLQDNSRDQVRRGRTAKGEKNASAKLTQAAVESIRRRFATGESQGHIARELGMSQPAISLIVRGKAWRHVA